MLYLAIAYDDLGSAGKEGLDQTPNILRLVLVVGVRIDYDVRPLPERCL